jgi:hypothetical protein
VRGCAFDHHRNGTMVLVDRNVKRDEKFLDKMMKATKGSKTEEGFKGTLLNKEFTLRRYLLFLLKLKNVM